MEEKERYEVHIYDDVCVDLYDNGVLNKSVNDTYKLENLLNQQDKELSKLRASYQQVKEENQQLKQQLHDLPKKIVEEIEEEIVKYDLLKNFPNEAAYCMFHSILDTILKKYGGEYESK